MHTNGVYGDRLLEICEAIGTRTAVLRTAAFTPPEPAQFAAMLDADPAISHVFIVHCETSTGILNPLDELAALCRAREVELLVDAVASFGAVDIDAAALGIEAITISSNKCMQGVPASAGRWCAARRWRRRDGHRRCAWTWPTRRGTWTAPGCSASRRPCRCSRPSRRHAANMRRKAAPRRGSLAIAPTGAAWWTVCGRWGFRTVVPDAAASPIVATFHNPDHPGFSFEALFAGMKRRGFVIFPGRLALENTFRIGCMGVVTEADIARAMVALADTMAEMGVSGFGRVDHPA